MNHPMWCGGHALYQEKDTATIKLYGKEYKNKCASRGCIHAEKPKTTIQVVAGENDEDN